MFVHRRAHRRVLQLDLDRKALVYGGLAESETRNSYELPISMEMRERKPQLIHTRVTYSEARVSPGEMYC